jgi:hypothetical protein
MRTGEDILFEDPIDPIDPIEDYNNNRDNMRGGPVCCFRNKNIPCFVGTSKTASNTSALLADMLKTIDDARVFEQISGVLRCLSILSLSVRLVKQLN